MRHEINLFQRLFSMKINICIHSTSLTHHKFSVNIVQLIHEKQFQQNSQKFFYLSSFCINFWQHFAATDCIWRSTFVAQVYSSAYTGRLRLWSSGAHFSSWLALTVSGLCVCALPDQLFLSSNEEDLTDIYGIVSSSDSSSDYAGTNQLTIAQ